ncbi:MAG: type I methionyl aminopeptidase [Victivallales bacterium]|nr:type I methionyl aminopeptidase [Victivallales bacterium]
MSLDKAVIHTEKEIEGIRKAARAAGFVREQLSELIKPGMSTKEIDELAASLIAATGGKSAFFGYRGFPGQICISLNEEVVHGIGTSAVIVKDGDIVSLDVGVVLNGYVGDNAETVALGATKTASVEHLLTNTRKSLYEAIKASVKGNYIRDIGAAVQKVAQKAKLGIVREYVGHGCGVKLHEPPEIPNYRTAGRGAKLKNGMVLAIEPMLNLGTHRVKTMKDGWTVKTLDGKLSAHFEHMILVNNDKPEILTWQKQIQ